MSSEAAVEIFGQQRALAPSIKEPGKARALAAWETMKGAWGDTLPGDSESLWAWLMDQSVDKLLELLAFVTAANLNAVKVKHDQSRARLANADLIAAAVGLDMCGHWTGDARFFSRLSKSDIAEVLDEVGCPAQVVRAIVKAPKATAAAEAGSQTQGKGWLPEILRPGPHDNGDRAA